MDIKSTSSLNTLRIATYNSRGLPKTNRGLLLRPDIVDVFNTSDIVCLQETWYLKQELGNLNTICDNFHGFGVSTTDALDGLVAGHPPGGVAILWRDSLDSRVKPLVTNLSWCSGIEIEDNQRKVVILSVYLPYQCNENEEKYLECLGELSALLQELDTTCYSVLGDWNANLKDMRNSLFARHMSSFCDEHDLIISSQHMLPHSSYTCVSAAWGSTSWLDHTVSSADFHDMITNMEIQYTYTDEDHIPLTLTASLERAPELTESTNSVNPKLPWDGLGEEECEQFCKLTHSPC